MITTVSVSLPGALATIVRALQNDGWRVDALANGAASCSRSQQIYSNCFHADLSRNPFHPSNLLRAAGQIRQAVLRGDYDIVHVHTPVAAFITRYALRGLPAARRPHIVYTAHGFHFFRGNTWHRNWAFRTLEKLAGPWTDTLVVINEEDHKAALALNLVPPANLVLMPGIGVDLQRHSPAAVPPAEVLRVREELNLSRDHVAFLCAAEFIPRKHHSDLLHAFARLGNPQAVLLLAGNGRDQERCRQLAASLGIASRTRFLGFRSDVPALMRASRAVVLCSDQEGLPLAVLEAQAMGVPVIGTDVRGTRDLLRQGGGRIVPLNDPAALAAAMGDLIRRPQEAIRLGAEGSDVARRYDVRQICDAHVQLYAAVRKEVTCTAGR
jgi:glycosyltransferase involved in cell wall biosynthesis